MSDLFRNIVDIEVHAGSSDKEAYASPSLQSLFGFVSDWMFFPSGNTFVRLERSPSNDRSYFFMAANGEVFISLCDLFEKIS